MEESLKLEIKSSPRKKIIFIFSSVLVLLVAAAGLWYFYIKNKPIKNQPLPVIDMVMKNKNEVADNLPAGFPIADFAKVIFSSSTPATGEGGVYSVQIQTKANPNENFTLYKNFFEGKGWTVTFDTTSQKSHLKFSAAKGTETITFETFLSPVSFGNIQSSSSTPGVILNPESIVSIKYYKN